MGKFFFKYRWRIFLLLLFPLFFIGGPAYGSTRLFIKAWNMGHILFFAVLAHEADSYLLAKNLSGRTKFTSIMLLILVLAIFIEVCQSFVSGRIASFLDITLGLIGGLAILAWKNAAQQTLKWRISLRVAVSSIIAICLLPLLFVAIDEYRAWRDFPILSNFESFSELSRWGGKSRFRRVREPVKSGMFSLMVPLNTDKYSGIAFNHFPNNWSLAYALTFSVYNPGEPITLNYRIHDLQHQQRKTQGYSDRFNSYAKLTAGWNTITVAINDIKSGPKTRKMDLEQIHRLMLFVVKQPTEKVIYIDDVKLLLKNRQLLIITDAGGNL